MFVKICGTTSEEDALLAVAMGADAVGFIFAPSVRQIAPVVVADIVKRLPPEILTVGVFRDDAPERVVEVVHAAGLKAAQLSGHETAEQAKWIRQRIPFLIQAFPAGDRAVRQAADHGADVVMVDAPTPGSGKVFDWSLAAEVPTGLRLLLAGGLTPDNVGAAIEAVRPWGVDVATGVERAPGRKDPSKLRAFIAAAKAASPSNGSADDNGTYDDGSDDAPFDWQEEELR